MLWSNTSDDFTVTSGAVTTIICELTCCLDEYSSLTPKHIVKESNGSYLSILFSPSMDCGGLKRQKEDNSMSLYILCFGIFNTRNRSNIKSTKFQVHHGREVLFLPCINSLQTSRFVLNTDGSSVCTLLKETDSEAVIMNDSKGFRRSENIEILFSHVHKRNRDSVD